MIQTLLIHLHTKLHNSLVAPAALITRTPHLCTAVALLLLSNILGCARSMPPSPTHAGNHPTITSRPFGELQSRAPVTEYILSSGTGVTASILTWGGIIRTLSTPDRNGDIADITLGFDSIAPYEARHPYFGTITGRFANRIAKGTFSLDGHTYKLATNNGPNHLHGGVHGFDRKNWDARIEESDNSVSLILSSVSPDGEEGYPGEVASEVRYTLTQSNQLSINYTATTTRATPINLTSHGYFNLAGHGSGDILNQMIKIDADSYIPVDKTLIPIGELRSVHGTPFDFRKPRAIGSRISEVGLGYDHTFVIRGTPGTMRRAAYAWDPHSGRSLEMWTDQPGVQFYTGNFLEEQESGKGRASYPKHSAFCLETQAFPDSVNQAAFPSVIVRPGETYSHSTVMKFGVTGELPDTSR